MRAHVLTLAFSPATNGFDDTALRALQRDHDVLSLREHALSQAQALLRRHGWSLKMDVAKFFPSLRHDMVLATVEALVAERCAVAHGAASARAVSRRARLHEDRQLSIIAQ